MSTKLKRWVSRGSAGIVTAALFATALMKIGHVPGMGAVMREIDEGLLVLTCVVPQLPGFAGVVHR